MRTATWCQLIQTFTNVIQYRAYLNIYKTWVIKAAPILSCEHDGYLKLRTASVSLGSPFLPKVRESGSPPTVPSQRDVARGTWHNSVSSSTVWLIGMKNKLVYLPFRLSDCRPFLLPRLCIPAICDPCQSSCSPIWPVQRNGTKLHFFCDLSYSYHWWITLKPCGIAVLILFSDVAIASRSSELNCRRFGITFASILVLKSMKIKAVSFDILLTVYRYVSQ
jgi:hypothetical protein